PGPPGRRLRLRLAGRGDGPRARPRLPDGGAAGRSRRPRPRAGGAMSLDWGREVTGQLAVGESREWLVTNGIGGFAAGTVAGLLTRRYHGLLVAALKPPLGRTVLVARIEESLECRGQTRPLGTNRWADRT